MTPTDIRKKTTPNSGPPGGEIAILGPLRGIAALAVMWFHFTRPSDLLPSGTSRFNDLLIASGGWGWMGVEIFFAISGFILPYSMYRGRYRIKYFLTFIIKRVVRIDPPYFASIALVLALWWLATHVPGFQGRNFQIDYSGLFAHVGYLNDILGYSWANPVYWTLALEFQFYLLIAILFPLAVHKRRSICWLFGPMLGLVQLCLPGTNTIFSWLGYFGLGVITFQAYSRIIPKWFFWVSLFALGAIVSENGGIAAATLAIGTCITILFASHSFAQLWNRPHRILSWIGAISYSLYLLHCPIGGKIINLGGRLSPSPWIACLFLAIGVAVSLLSAWIFYVGIERPAKRVASSIRYRSNKVELNNIQIDESPELIAALKSQSPIYLCSDDADQQELLLNLIVASKSLESHATHSRISQIAFCNFTEAATLRDNDATVLDLRPLLRRAA